MNICPNCGANIDGLISWCDCCGASIAEPEFVVLFEHDYIDSSDIGNYLRPLVTALNKQSLRVTAPSISTIELVTFCYPSALVDELKLKSHSRFSRKDQRATITIVFNYELYTAKSQTEKKAYIVSEVKRAVLDFFRKRKFTDFTVVQTLIDSIQI